MPATARISCEASSLAVKEANAGGGVAGHTFEVVVADTKDASAAAVTSAGERLLGTEGVHVILTGYASLSMFEVELMADAGMPYLAAGPSPQFAAIVGRTREPTTAAGPLPPTSRDMKRT